MTRVSAPILFALAMLSSTSAIAQKRESSFDFAKTKIAGFEVKAITEIEWSEVDPFIEDIRCEGTSDDVSFAVNRKGGVEWLHLSFNAPPDEDGNRESITYLGDTLWLYLDGQKYQYVSIGSPSNRFSNYDYPPEEDREIILIWTGYRALKTSEDGPLVEMKMFYKDIVDARKIEWGFKSRNWNQVNKNIPDNALPKGWEQRRYKVDNVGLSEAVDWCVARVASKDATVIPHEIATVKK